MFEMIQQILCFAPFEKDWIEIGSRNEIGFGIKKAYVEIHLPFLYISVPRFIKISSEGTTLFDLEI